MDVGLNQIVRKISGVVIEKTSPSPPIFRGKNLKTGVLYGSYTGLIVL